MDSQCLSTFDILKPSTISENQVWLDMSEHTQKAIFSCIECYLCIKYQNDPSQQTFTGSKSTGQTFEKGMKYV